MKPLLKQTLTLSPRETLLFRMVQKVVEALGEVLWISKVTTFYRET